MNAETLKAFARYDIATERANDAKALATKYSRSVRWAQIRVREARAEGYSIDDDRARIDGHRVESLSSIDSDDDVHRGMETDPWSVAEDVSKSRDETRNFDVIVPGPAETEVQSSVDEQDHANRDDDLSNTGSTNDRLGGESLRIESLKYLAKTNVDSTPIDEQDQPKNNAFEQIPINNEVLPPYNMNAEPITDRAIEAVMQNGAKFVVDKRQENKINDSVNKPITDKELEFDIWAETEPINTLGKNKGNITDETPEQKEDQERKEVLHRETEELAQEISPPQKARVSPKLLSFTSRASAVIVALVAGVASYIHIVSVALQSGEDRFVAHIIPFSLDGLIIVATMAMLEDRHNGQKPRIVARVALIVGIIGTLAANVASAGTGLPPEAIAVIPAVAFLLSVEVLVSGGKKLT